MKSKYINNNYLKSYLYVAFNNLNKATVIINVRPKTPSILRGGGS